MPLSKARNRDRMRVSRATQVQPKAVQPSEAKLDALRNLITQVEKRPAPKIWTEALKDATQSKSSPPNEGMSGLLPVQPSVQPNIDADGNEIFEEA